MYSAGQIASEFTTSESKFRILSGTNGFDERKMLHGNMAVGCHQMRYPHGLYPLKYLKHVHSFTVFI